MNTKTLDEKLTKDHNRMFIKTLAGKITKDLGKVLTKTHTGKLAKRLAKNGEDIQRRSGGAKNEAMTNGGGKDLSRVIVGNLAGGLPRTSARGCPRTTPGGAPGTSPRTRQDPHREARQGPRRDVRQGPRQEARRGPHQGADQDHRREARQDVRMNPHQAGWAEDGGRKHIRRGPVDRTVMYIRGGLSRPLLFQSIAGLYTTRPFRLDREEGRQTRMADNNRDV